MVIGMGGRPSATGTPRPAAALSILGSFDICSLRAPVSSASAVHEVPGDPHGFRVVHACVETICGYSAAPSSGTGLIVDINIIMFDRLCPGVHVERPRVSGFRLVQTNDSALCTRRREHPRRRTNEMHGLAPR